MKGLGVPKSGMMFCGVEGPGVFLWRGAYVYAQYSFSERQRGDLASLFCYYLNCQHA